MSFNVIFLTRIAMITIRLLLYVVVLRAMFLRAIFIYLLVSTFVYSIIIFLTFEALMNTTHLFFLTHTRFDIICWLMRDSIIYKSVCVSMSYFCRLIIFYSIQNFFFSEDSRYSEQITSSSSISRSWRFWIALVMRCLSLCVSSMWYSFACLEFWLLLLSYFSSQSHL